MDMDQPADIRKFDLGDVMRVARARRRWTQTELGLRTSMRPANISLIENGRKDIRLSTLVRIADALGMTLTLTDRAA